MQHKVNLKGFSETVSRRCSVNKLSLEIAQNSPENDCTRFSFIMKLQALGLWKGLWHRCFPVNFAKFRRTPFVTEHLLLLLLNISRKKKCIVESYIPTSHFVIFFSTIYYSLKSGKLWHETEDVFCIYNCFMVSYYMKGGTEPI